MKKRLVILLTSALAALPVLAASGTLIDPADYDTEELVRIRELAVDELGDRIGENESTIGPGMYVAGTDLDAGSYLYTCTDTVSRAGLAIYESAEELPVGNFNLNITLSEDCEFAFTLEEGQVLHIGSGNGVLKRDLHKWQASEEDSTAVEQAEDAPLTGSAADPPDGTRAVEDISPGRAEIPAAEFVADCLGKIDSVTGTGIVTEDHDPNGQLGKQGGYTGCVYFRDSRTDSLGLYRSGDEYDVIEVGTEGGGCIEIYASEADAEKRDAYLAGFDGSVVPAGSHSVAGTMVIRISPHLTDSDQSGLTEAIKALLGLEDVGYGGIH